MIYECLKCGCEMKCEVSLCPNCLEEEFRKMDHGDPSGYLYAGDMYLRLEEKRKAKKESSLKKRDYKKIKRKYFKGKKIDPDWYKDQ